MGGLQRTGSGQRVRQAMVRDQRPQRLAQPSAIAEQPFQLRLDHLLDGPRRQSPPAALSGPLPVPMRLRCVIAIPDVAPARVNRPQAIARLVDQQTGQEMEAGAVGDAPAHRRPLGEQGLDRREGVLADDGLMLAVMDLLAVPHLADIDRVRQDMIELPPSEAARG